MMYGQRRPQRSVWGERMMSNLLKIAGNTYHRRRRTYKFDPNRETTKDKRARLMAEAEQARIDKAKFEELGYDV